MAGGKNTHHHEGVAPGQGVATGQGVAPGLSSAEIERETATAQEAFRATVQKHDDFISFGIIVPTADMKKFHRATELEFMASSLCDDYIAGNNTDVADLRRAAALVKEAIDMTPEDFPQKGTFYNSLMTIYYFIFKGKDGTVDDIFESEKYGRLACTSTSPVYETSQQALHARRASLLARTLLAIFEDPVSEGQKEEYLDAALTWAGTAADESDTNTEIGMKRFGEFCRLCIVKSELVDNLRMLKGAIGLRKKQCYHPFQEDHAAHPNLALMNLNGLLWLLGKQYQYSKESEDYADLLEVAKSNLTSSSTDDTATRLYKTALTTALNHAICACGDYSCTRIEDIDTAIFLYELALEAVPSDTTVADLRRRLDLTVGLEWLADTKWRRFDDPVDGSRAEEYEYQHATILSLLQFAQSGNYTYENIGDLLTQLKGNTRATTWHSRVNGDRVTRWSDGREERKPKAVLEKEEADKKTKEASGKEGLTDQDSINLLQEKLDHAELEDKTTTADDGPVVSYTATEIAPENV